MGLMIRFSAGSAEVGALLRFLRRRAPAGRLFVAALDATERRHSERTERRTERPLLRRLAADKAGGAWAMLTAQDKNGAGRAAPLLILHLGAADALGRRDGMLEARDEIAGDPPDYTARCHIARNLAERCARRVRHRGTPGKGRWSLPI